MSRATRLNATARTVDVRGAFAPIPSGSLAVGQLVIVTGTSPLTLSATDVVAIDKTSIGLDQVDNTSDANKPISTAVSAALLARATAPPKPAIGQYTVPCGANTASTSSTLVAGTLRLAPWLVHRAITIDRIGAEITTIGDVGSLLRLGIYADNGNAHPGSLVLDAGTIAGDSATGQTLTISQALQPGLYWIGGVIQAATTTQPTVRVVGGSWVPPIPLPMGSSAPSAGTAYIGHSMTGVTGALPATFDTTVTGQITLPRVWVRVSA